MFFQKFNVLKNKKLPFSKNLPLQAQPDTIKYKYIYNDISPLKRKELKTLIIETKNSLDRLNILLDKLGDYVEKRCDNYKTAATVTNFLLPEKDHEIEI